MKNEGKSLHERETQHIVILFVDKHLTESCGRKCTSFTTATVRPACPLYMKMQFDNILPLDIRLHIVKEGILDEHQADYIATAGR